MNNGGVACGDERARGIDPEQSSLEADNRLPGMTGPTIAESSYPPQGEVENNGA